MSPLWGSVPGSLVLDCVSSGTIIDVIVHMLPQTLMISAMIYTFQSCHSVCTGHMPTNVIIISMCTCYMPPSKVSKSSSYDSCHSELSPCL